MYLNGTGDFAPFYFQEALSILISSIAFATLREVSNH